MTALHTRQQSRLEQSRHEREGSHSSNLSSIYDYDTDEIRRRWSLSPQPRARSLTRDEAREIIDRQLSSDSYTGYTYGDSISYRSDGNLEYLHPYLNHRKHVDFGADGDVVDYRPSFAKTVQLKRRRQPLHHEFWNLVRKNGLDFVSFGANQVFRFILFLVQLLISFGMFLGSLAMIGYQKAVPFFSSKISALTSTSSSVISKARRSISPAKGRSPRGRRRVSFASSPIEEPQSTSTPLALSARPASPALVHRRKPLHVYAWNFIKYPWELTKTVVTNGFEKIQDLSGKASEKVSGSAESAYDFVHDKLASDQEPHRRRSRGRPPKVAPVEEPRALTAVKSAASSGTSFAINKMAWLADNLAFLVYALAKGVTRGVTYVQNNYASAQKSRNWLPLLLLLLLLLGLGWYGYHNKQHKNRDIPTALQQDFQVARQWTSSKMNDAYNALPAPSGVFKTLTNPVRSLFSFIGSVLGNLWSLVSNLFGNFFSFFGSIVSNTWSGIGSVFEKIYSLITSLLGNVWSSITYVFSSIGQTLRKWTNIDFSKISEYVPNPLNIISSVFNRLRSVVYTIVYFAYDFVTTVGQGIYNLFASIVYGIYNLFASIGHGIYNLFSSGGQGVYNLVSSGTQGVYNLVSSGGKGVYNLVSSGTQGAYNLASSGTEKVYNVVSSGSHGIYNLVSSGRHGIYNLVSSGGHGIYNLFNTAIQGIYGFISSIGQGIFSIFSTFRQWIVSVYNHLPSPTGTVGNIVENVKYGCGFAYGFASGFVQDVVSKVSNFGGNLFTSVIELTKNAFAFIGSLVANTVGFVRDLFTGGFGHVSHVIKTTYHWIITKFSDVYGFLPDFSSFFSVAAEQSRNFVSYISNFFVNLYNSATNWAFRPAIEKAESVAKPIIREVEKIVYKAVPANFDMSEVEKLINERISKYDADKTGQPDYALESSGGSIIGIGCTKVYEETSRLQSIFGIPLYFSNYSPRTVIQRRANSPTAGECWPYIGGHGELFINLSHKINVTSVSYEHLSPRLSPEGHMKTAPKEFRVWSIHNHGKANERKHLLGDFTYIDGGEALQTFETQFPDENLTETIGLETYTNHGSPVTCLYRFRVHGKPPIAPSEPV